MKTNDIKILLEAFYNGETSAGEDRILMDYFRGEEVAEELKDEQKIFLAMYEAEPVDVPLSLESEMNSLIDGLAGDESKEAQKVELKPQDNRRIMWTWIASAVAGVAILVSAGIFFNKPAAVIPDEPAIAQQQPDEPEMPEADKQAVKEAKEALILLSAKFNKGVNQLAVVSSNIEKTNEVLNKSFNRKKDKES
ncbi:MAG: hypothetical protein LBL79_06385 [Prevotella sp.]|jgi:hypothetical protein|nr:hypothetical protein [Prevotella sp.]